MRNLIIFGSACWLLAGCGAEFGVRTIDDEGPGDGLDRPGDSGGDDTPGLPGERADAIAPIDVRIDELPDDEPPTGGLPEEDYVAGFVPMGSAAVWGDAEITTFGYLLEADFDLHGFEPGSRLVFTFHGFPADNSLGAPANTLAECPDASTDLDGDGEIAFSEAHEWIGDPLLDLGHAFTTVDGDLAEAMSVHVGTWEQAELLPLERKTLIVRAIDPTAEPRLVGCAEIWFANP